MLELLHKHLDSKGKQAKLKSPQELQVNSLLYSMAYRVSFCWRVSGALLAGLKAAIPSPLPPERPCSRHASLQ